MIKDITMWLQTAHNYIVTAHMSSRGNCNMRTLFVQVKFKITLPRALPHTYSKLSCFHLTLNCLLVLAHMEFFGVNIRNELLKLLLFYY